MARRKFEGADFSELPVNQLVAGDPPDDRGFRCSRREFVTYWRKGRVLRDLQSSVSQCWYIRHESSFAGYITLFADKLVVGDGEQVLLDEGVKYQSFPAVKIGLLAADERAKGAGTRLLEWALEYIATDLWSRVGIRFVTVDALYDPDTGYDTADYYRKFGFVLADPHQTLPPPDPFRTMFLDIVPFVEALKDVS